MTCSNCGRPIPEGSRFCIYCGERQTSPVVSYQEMVLQARRQRKAVKPPHMALRILIFCWACILFFSSAGSALVTLAGKTADANVTSAAPYQQDIHNRDIWIWNVCYTFLADGKAYEGRSCVPGTAQSASLDGTKALYLPGIPQLNRLNTDSLKGTAQVQGAPGTAFNTVLGLVFHMLLVYMMLTIVFPKLPSPGRKRRNSCDSCQGGCSDSCQGSC